MEDQQNALVRTFLIADIRGYTRFTERHGDEASARLAATFRDIVSEGVQVRGGTLIEIRGDEALAVFDSARQALRAAVDLQNRFAEETDADSNCPIKVGIGIDSGEAIKLDDGSFRGAALNVAARLCGLAQGGEIIVSEGTSHLAGRLPGLRYVDRGRAHLKGIADTVRLIRVVPEGEQEQSQPWILMIFGKPGRIGWRVALGVVADRRRDGSRRRLPDRREQGETSSGATPATETTPVTTPSGSSEKVAPAADVIALIPTAPPQRLCQAGCAGHRSGRDRRVPTAGRRTGFRPDRWQVSIYPSGAAVQAAYEAERQRQKLGRNSGTCSSLSWGGEGAWAHGPGKPGGRRLCYFDGDDAVIVWSHERLGQANHRDVLGIAREGGSDHVRLIGWWTFAHHLIGKVE